MGARLDNLFDDLYRRLTFLSVAREPCALHRVCASRSACWQNAEGRYPPDGDSWSHIARPWVGAEYEKLRLLAVAENLNEYGGLEALCELAEESKDLLRKGFRRVRFHAAFSEYAGSFLWHRLASYSAAIAEAQGSLEVSWLADGYPSPQDAARAFDFIAFAEHVKCSPKGDKSAPTVAMWENCGRHVLREEILVLRPAVVLVLGRSNNNWYLRERVCDTGYQSRRKIGQVERARAQVGDVDFAVFIVPHPQAYGGSAASILADLKCALAA